MGSLRYLTLANASPQGKPRVLMVCHPDDFVACRQTICPELFRVVNCAVYYMSPDEEYDPEEILDDVSQMQLFVFGVTGKLLTEPNIGMDVLFSYAEEHHIPVLPLLQEEVNLDDYSKRFGDLQFLNRLDITPTSITYEEKLKKYLNSVLVDDELAQKVRDAFDAYIFLSYRKKDRKYAQELMRLIHKNEFCRDVAIWYDEFLVPGENFNTAIGEMIQKSDLFALAVTPNLVNEINYVMTTEYPDALKRNKKILAAEMVATERGELESKYESFPECTDPRDEQMFAKALQDALGRISLREENSDSDHLYCIGLAYLGGIDVEVDHERALSLITAASENGNFDATQKLVSMYTNGEGVARSYKKAIELQESYVSMLDGVYENIEPIRVSTSYPEALYTLSTLYEYSKNQTLQKETLLRLLNISNKYNQKWKDIYKMAAIHSLGELAGNRGDYQEAREYFLESLTECQKGMDAGSTGESGFYARTCLLLANLSRKYNDRAEAKEYYLKAIDVADRYSNHHDFTSTYLSAYISLGNLETEDGNLSEAEKLFEKAEVLVEELQMAGKDVSASSINLIQKKNALKVEREYKKELNEIYLDYYRNMSSDPEQDKKDFQKMQQRIKELNERKERAVSRKDEVKKQAEILEGLSENAESMEIEDRRKFADAQMNLGISHMQNQEYEEAKGPLEKAYIFYESYLKDNKDSDADSYLVVIMYGLAEVYEHTGDREKAEKFEKDAMVLAEENVNKRGNTRDYQQLINVYSGRAAKEKVRGDIKEAEAIYKKAIEKGKAFTEMDNGRKPRQMLASLYYSMAYLKGLQPDPKYMAKSYKIYMDLKEEYPDDKQILTGLNRIRGSFMMSGIPLSKLDEYLDDTGKEKEKEKKTGLLGRLFGKK